MKPLEILVDQDGVTTDFEKGLLNEWRTRFPDRPYVPLAERTTFYPRDQYPEEFKNDLEAIYLAEGFYRNLPPIDGAVEALREMRSRGHIVKICTSPLSRNPYCIPEKMQWVKQFLGEEWLDLLIITKDKEKVYGDILIDDNPNLPPNGLLGISWEHIIYDQPYNRHIVEKRRLTSWKNWRELLES